jgi:hypothetical protein
MLQLSDHQNRAGKQQSHSSTGKHPDNMLNTEWSAPVLDAALKKYTLECSATPGFLACGLHPWNPENPDFAKCLGKN